MNSGDAPAQPFVCHFPRVSPVAIIVLPLSG